MRPRHTLTDLFSTFLQFEADRVSRWVTDSRLRRSMQYVLAQLPEAPPAEQFWVVYWCRCWHTQTDAVAAAHLAAYLQETCYWVAQKTMSRVPSSQFGLSDCFQLAIAALPRILRGFDPDGIASLKTFATTAFGNVIRDALRQRREIDGSSDWGLLLKLSRKRLLEALQRGGLSAETIDRYLCAWTCFEAAYIQTKPAKMRQLQRPDPAIWDEIARLYNRDRPSPNTLEIDATPEVLEKWLLACVKHVRDYLYPAVASLNAPQAGQDTGELQDQLPDDRADSLLTTLMAQEETKTRQAQQRQLAVVLTNALANLDAQAQTLMSLYYQETLTQQQIAAQLGIPQYTVSRRLSKAREALLLALAKWSQETLHIATTSNVLKHMSTVLEEWLEDYYRPTTHDSAKESL